MSNLIQILYSLTLFEAYIHTESDGYSRYRLSTFEKTHRFKFLCPSHSLDDMQCKEVDCEQCPLLAGIVNVKHIMHLSKTKPESLARLLVIGIGDELSNRIEAFNQMEH